MLERIFNQISKADVLVADMTGKNPNVFYEVGYAHALGKLVLLLTQDSADIPFDLRHRPHIVYGGGIDMLRKELTPRLAWALAEAKKGGSGISSRFAVSIDGKESPEARLNKGYPTIEVKYEREGHLIVTLPISIRNDSAETTRAITHMYILAAEDSAMVPARDIGMRHQQAMRPVDAPVPDALLGTALKYRFDAIIPPMPQQATEQETLTLHRTNAGKTNDTLFILRVHYDTGMYDFPFCVQLVKSEPHEAKRLESP